MKPAQQACAFARRVTKTARGRFLLHLPRGYSGKKSWPLLFFLHGAGERGDNLHMVKIHGPPKLIAQGKHFPFIVVSPQCPADDWWDTDVLGALLDDICERYAVDEDRIYATGLSMGGNGTWKLAMEFPHRFAAIAPICGGGNPYLARRIAHLPAWVFHGAKDEVVKLDESRKMVDVLRKLRAPVKFTVYPKTGHDSWTATYNNPQLYRWLLKHRRKLEPTGEDENPV